MIFGEPYCESASAPSLCKLFKRLSYHVWHAILRSRLYSHRGSDGMLETSITDGLLHILHSHWRHECVVYVPRELKTGADLDLLLMAPQSQRSPTQAPKGMHFRLQAKKLNRQESYTKLNRANRHNKYQADLLCSSSGFFPLYLFYNCYSGLSTTERKNLVGEGCTIASGHRVRAAIHPGPSGKSALKLDALIRLQRPWWTLVCRDQGTLAKRAQAAAIELHTMGQSAEEGEHPLSSAEDIAGFAYHDLEGVYRELWNYRGAPFPFVDHERQVERPIVMILDRDSY